MSAYIGGSPADPVDIMGSQTLVPVGVATSRIGRPALFNERVRFAVYLDRTDLRAIQTVAAREGVSAAEWARRRLTVVAQQEDAMKPKKTAKGRDQRPRKGLAPTAGRHLADQILAQRRED